MLVEALGPPWSEFDLVVQRQLIALAVEREAAARDAVGEAADRDPEEVRMVHIILGLVIAEQASANLPLRSGAISDCRVAP